MTPIVNIDKCATEAYFYIASSEAVLAGSKHNLLPGEGKGGTRMGNPKSLLACLKEVSEEERLVDACAELHGRLNEICRLAGSEGNLPIVCPVISGTRFSIGPISVCDEGGNAFLRDLVWKVVLLRPGEEPRDHLGQPPDYVEASSVWKGVERFLGQFGWTRAGWLVDLEGPEGNQIEVAKLDMFLNLESPGFRVIMEIRRVDKPGATTGPPISGKR